MSKKISQTYVKLSPQEHVLLRPDTYVGSIQLQKTPVWILEQNKIIKKNIQYIPALYKIFDQILVNAADNYQRDKKMKTIEVKINQKSVSIFNDGESIPVQIHKQHKIYVPELVFGHFLTSSNYDDSIKKVTGGRNGMGGKLANIFSKQFNVEIGDGFRKKQYKMTWKQNMKIKGQQQIKNYMGKDFTLVQFKPDFNKFKIKQFSQDMIALMKKRVYDIAGILKVDVYLNNQLIKLNNFKQYVNLYNMSRQSKIISQYKVKKGQWHIILQKSDGEFNQISFVNSICTRRGGSHVNYIMDQIIDKLQSIISKKKKQTIKPILIKSHFNIYINCLIQNPSFDSQTKQTLTSKIYNFGSVCQLSQQFINQVVKSNVIQQILKQNATRQLMNVNRVMKKSKKNRLIIPKLQDANEAGISNKCCLILTEGDSAKSLALCGIQVLGRDYYGVYPLKGKIMNVRDLNVRQFSQNEQLMNLIKIIGLQMNKKYTDTRSLRYSSVMIMADQDNDGSHIKGLVLNFFETFWPQLTKIQGFLKQFITPIVKCKKGGEQIQFYSTADYNKWKQQSHSGWSIKYYKGLGTSTSKQAKQYFKNLLHHQITFTNNAQQNHEALLMAFDKKKIQQRKQWLSNYNPQITLDYSIKQVSIKDFINKQLIHYSTCDNIRSIPSIIDGLKPSQRKILYACFKRNLTNQIKVAQLAGYVAEHSSYHHGQISLCNTIVSMAQNYVGANNLNLLQPLGQFGTRYMNGKDAASSRYIFTKLNNLTRYLFNQADDHVVQYLEDDNQIIQPKYYLPILPLVLINGSQGIGSGWSTTIPSHLVSDVIALVRYRLQAKHLNISIGWQNFKGQILQQKGSFLVKGLYYVQNNGDVTINELPISKSIRDYKDFLQSMILSQQNQDPYLQDIKQYHQDNDIEFVLRFVQQKLPDQPQLQKFLKLTTSYQTSNMIGFDKNGRIKKYSTIHEILQDFYKQRLLGYINRKNYLISKYKKQKKIVDNQIKFISQIINGKFSIVQNKKSWIQKLQINNFQKYQHINKVLSNKNKQIQDNDKNYGYNYLLNMPIWSFCQDKISQLNQVSSQIATILNYYQKSTPQQLWIKDLDIFEQKWLQHKQGIVVKKRQSKKQNRQIINQNKKTSKRRTKTKIQDQNEDQIQITLRSKKLNNNEVNLFRQQQSLKMKSFKHSSQIQPLDLQIPQKQERPRTSLDSIFSKYLSDKHSELGLFERIKSRIKGDDQDFNNSYRQAKQNMKMNKQKLQQNNNDQFDIL